MKRKIIKTVFLAALCFAPCWGGMPIEAAGQQTQTSYIWQESGYMSSSFSSVGAADSSESTLYFNDGFGRLTEFYMTRKNQTMTLIIRQNMNVVWKGRVEVDQNTFSVAREERMGQVSFRITMGNKEYEATVDKDDHWNVTEKAHGNGKEFDIS